MSKEKDLTNLIQHLQISYNTLLHYTKQGVWGVETMNLEYTKKFLYERLEAAIRELNTIRTFKSNSTALQSTIMGELNEWKASTMNASVTYSTMVGTGEIPRGHIQKLSWIRSTPEITLQPILIL